MDVNGCHIVSVLCADGDEGFSSTVSRYVGVRWLTDLINGIPADAIKVERGPFLSIPAAVLYAHSWSDATTPPPMPLPKPKVIVPNEIDSEQSEEDPPNDSPDTKESSSPT